MKKPPYFSLITVTYNSERFLRDTIESVLGQTYKDFEYLIMDGGSTDSTLDLVKSFNDPRIQVFSEKDQGISDAMNKGIRKANGEVVGIIHSDDFYEPKALEWAAEAIGHSQSLWCYGEIHYIDEAGKILYTAGRPFDLELLKRNMIITHPSVFVRKKLYDQMGVFETKYRMAMDYDLSLRFAIRSAPVFIPQVMARMRLGGTSSKHLFAEYKTAFETLKIKRALIPGYWFSAYSICFWSCMKSSVRRLFQITPGCGGLVDFFRKKVNPNFVRGS